MSTQFFMLIPNMLFVLTETLIVTNEIAEYWPKNAIFAYPEQVGLDFGHVRSFISKQIIHEFVAREKLYRMV
jgi:hypothetical protein